MKTIATIVVGVDFTPHSLDALDDAIDLASQLGASIVAVHACDLPTAMAFPEQLSTVDPDLTQRALEEASTRLQGVVRERADRGVAIESVLRFGKAWEQIEVVAEERDAGLIVVGAGSHRGALRALLGQNVATTIVRTARTPVLAICSS
jgi:nucleotide-binding universal stress UspA family protein